MNKKALIGSFLALIVSTIIIAVLLILSIVFSSLIKGEHQNPLSSTQLSLDLYQILYNQMTQTFTIKESSDEYIQKNFEIFKIKDESEIPKEIIYSSNKWNLIKDKELIPLENINIKEVSGQGSKYYYIQLDTPTRISENMKDIINKLKELDYIPGLNLLNQEKDSSMKINSYNEVLK